MNTYHPEFYRKTYEYEANPLSHEFPPYNSIKDPSYKTSQEKFSNSPPIILCETGDSRNNKTHKHRYLFYPSASRLSPFTDNNNNYLNYYNIIKSTLRDEDNLSGEIGNKKNLINKNETSLNRNEKSPEKYQAMYDKSFELVKRISELVPGENIKLKGNSDYYLAKDKDYMNIIDNQIDSLTNHFKNNNFNLGYKTDVNMNKNSNLNSPNDENQMTYDQYKNNLLQRIKNSNKEINPNDFNYNYKENNIEENKDFKNNMENEINNKNRNYINDYINDLNAKKNGNNQQKENIEINEPEIQNKNILKNKNLNNNINDDNNNYNINEDEKYVNQNYEKNNNIINNENDQLMNNNIENDLNENNNQKKEEPLINTNDKKISQSTKYNTLGMIQGTNDNLNINPNLNQPLDNNMNINNLKYESNNLNKEYEAPNTITFTPYQLVDEKNNKIILSPEGKPFKGELVENQYQKGNQIFIRTKTGSDIKLNILRSKEGEPLTYKGYPLMGNEQKFFYDKDGNIIVYPDNEFIKGDKAVEVGIQNPYDKNNLVEFCINKNNFDLFGTDNREEFRGSGNGGFKKSKKKNKWYMFPKGDGGAKAPIFRKKKKRRCKI